MPETKKSEPEPQAEAKRPEASDPPKSASPSTRRPSPGESTDPDVQFLIANRAAHELILRGQPNDHNRQHAEAAIADIDKQLRGMGYR